jgi:flagellar biosynthesis/type III secretory pathway chaperone
MNDILERLINGLREELQQYGEMLALLDQQQEFVVARAAEEVLQTVTSIQGQSLVIQNARAQREEQQRQLARSLGRPESAPFSVIIPLMPEDYRPLAGALVEENNALLMRIQQRARQNHLLLSRSVELLQRFLSTLLPSMHPRVYNGVGSVLSATLPTQSLYEAVG